MPMVITSIVGLEEFLNAIAYAVVSQSSKPVASIIDSWKELQPEVRQKLKEFATFCEDRINGLTCQAVTIRQLYRSMPDSFFTDGVMPR